MTSKNSNRNDQGDSKSWDPSPLTSLRLGYVHSFESE
jgi:hypothetical protein